MNLTTEKVTYIEDTGRVN